MKHIERKSKLYTTSMWADAKQMAVQPNIGGALCESSLIPFLVPCHKIWLTATAPVPCSNVGDMGECKSLTQSQFCSR